MKIIVKSMNDEFEEKEIVLTSEEIFTLKQVDFVEIEEDRFSVFELVYRLDVGQFVLWLEIK